MIESAIIEGLRVRGYREGNSINLPPMHTREIIPADKSDIPTPEMAMRWPHLAPIAN